MFKELFLEIYKYYNNDKPKTSDSLYVIALLAVVKIVDYFD